MPMRIQLSFELENLMNTRSGFFRWRKDRRTSPYIVVTTFDNHTNIIGKTETYVFVDIKL